MIWIILITIALLIACSLGYREVQVLIERGSWKWESYWKRLYWFTNQNDPNEKDKDSFHVSNGFTVTLISFLEALVIYFGYYFYTGIILYWWWIPIYTVIFWIGQFWIRNIWMHIVSKKKPLWNYLVPFNLLKKIWR